MAEQNLNVRLQQKFATLTEWLSVQSKKPLSGEVCIFEISSVNELQNAAATISTPTALESVTTFPIHISKTGDGEHTLAELPWDGALAIDVYPWAKAPTAPITNIDVSASDDDVVILTGSGGAGIVGYQATHAKKGPSAGYTSDNTTLTVTGGGAAASTSKVKIPQLTVDDYGHVTNASDEEISIIIPPNEVPHTHDVTAAGTITNKFTGSAATITSDSYTPAGTITAPFTGDAGTATGTFTPSGTISTIEHQPEGTISTIVHTPNGTVTSSFTGTKVNIESNYTPAGTVSTPTITITPTTGTVKQITDVGTAPTFGGTYDSANQKLTLNWNAGTVPTATNTSVITGISKVESTQPTFTGTPGVATSVDYTPTGDVDSGFVGAEFSITPTFEGKEFSITPTFTGDEGDISATYTPKGTINATFKGTAATIRSAYTPAGTVESQFEGSSVVSGTAEY